MGSISSPTEETPSPAAPTRSLTWKKLILDLIQGCSHGRAPDYFIESINGSPKFVSGKCDSYANWASGACSSGIRTNMGFGVSTSVRGQFYLVTNAATPFAKG